MKKSNMLYNEYIYKCIAVKWEDTGDVQEQHELPPDCNARFHSKADSSSITCSVWTPAVHR